MGCGYHDGRLFSLREQLDVPRKDDPGRRHLLADILLALGHLNNSLLKLSDALLRLAGHRQHVQHVGESSAVSLLDQVQHVCQWILLPSRILSVEEEASASVGERLLLFTFSLFPLLFVQLVIYIQMGPHNEDRHASHPCLQRVQPIICDVVFFRQRRIREENSPYQSWTSHPFCSRASRRC